MLYGNSLGSLVFAVRRPCMLAGVALMLALVSGCGQAPAERGSGDARAMRDRLRDHALQWVEQGELTREDGYVYAIDVTQFAIYAARAGDAELYELLRQRIVSHLVIERNGNTYVAWRYHPDGRPLDASGTTEALRAAQALWLGAAAFDRPGDRELAIAICRGYAAHAYVDQGIWLIRNYYNIGTNSYATNSYLIDYAPDFLARVAEATDDAALRDVAQRSAALVRRAQAPAGLLYQVIQPELKTLMPARQAVFSPNNVVQLSNTLEVAEHSAETCPEVAGGVLRFVETRWPNVAGYYNARTGAAMHTRTISANALAPLLRLAVQLDNDTMRDRVLSKLVEQAAGLPKWSRDARAHTTGQTLLALQAALDDAGNEKP